MTVKQASREGCKNFDRVCGCHQCPDSHVRRRRSYRLSERTSRNTLRLALLVPSSYLAVLSLLRRFLRWRIYLSRSSSLSLVRETVRAEHRLSFFGTLLKQKHKLTAVIERAFVLWNVRLTDSLSCRTLALQLRLKMETENSGIESFLGAVRNQNVKVVTYTCEINVIAEKLFSALLELFHIFFLTCKIDFLLVDRGVSRLTQKGPQRKP